MNVGIFIGRFQPMHRGHMAIINHMLGECEKVIILVGSANVTRSLRNPFTFIERKRMLQESIKVPVTIMPLNDHKYSDEKWCKEVDLAVSSETRDSDTVRLYGHMKAGNDYLNMLPYEYVNIESDDDICSTHIREQMLAERTLPDEVLVEYDNVCFERNLFASYPYPETVQFLTVDVLLFRYGQVLLVKRKYAPGRGTYALPGGFKNNNETSHDAALRELREECGIDLKQVSQKQLISSVIFDSPTRNIENGSIPRITIVYCYHLATYVNVTLTASDDAESCDWFDIDDAINNLNMFSDHRDIICKQVGLTPQPAFLNKRYRDKRY